MNYRSIADMCNVVRKNIEKVPKDVDLIVGVPRSGLFVANYIALIMNKPLSDFNGLLEGRMLSAGRTKDVSNNIKDVLECKKILIVDDSVASGKSIIECKEKLEGFKEDVEIIFCTVYVISSSIDLVDIYFEILDPPRIFEWNLFHYTSILKRTLFDLDGVLCRDPSDEENDDGINYLTFLKNTEAKIIPVCSIGGIVTSRLEKYRESTEKWLNENDVKYDSLIMLQATSEERRNKQLYAIFKAEVYKKSDAILFIESSENQAIEICNISHKPVYCIENNLFYDGNKLYHLQYEPASKIKNLLRRSKFLKKIYFKVGKK